MKISLNLFLGFLFLSLSLGSKNFSSEDRIFTLRSPETTFEEALKNMNSTFSFLKNTGSLSVEETISQPQNNQLPPYRLDVYQDKSETRFKAFYAKISFSKDIKENIVFPQCDGEWDEELQGYYLICFNTDTSEILKIQTVKENITHWGVANYRGFSPNLGVNVGALQFCSPAE